MVSCEAARQLRRRADGGQATVLMIMLLIASVGAAAVIVEVGILLDESARARTAADAAALAGAVEGKAAAAQLAEANGGTLVSYNQQEIDGSETWATVTVRVGRASQNARAASVVEWVLRR